MKENETTKPSGKNSLDRMADLTRRVVAVKKSDLPTNRKPPKQK